MIQELLEQPSQSATHGDDEPINPPLMPPSVKEEEYSLVSLLYPLSLLRLRRLPGYQWCSLCKDRNTALLLCAGCRMGICVQDLDSVHTGCLKPSPAVQKDDFVFFCPFCCRRNKTVFPVSACPFCAID